MIIKILRKIGRSPRKVLTTIQHLNRKWIQPKRYRLRSVTEWAKQNNCPIFITGKVEPVYSIDPPVFNQNGYQKPGMAPKVALSNLPYVAELQNAVIYSRSSIIIAGKSALHDAMTHASYGRYVDLAQDATLIRRESDTVYMRHTDYRIHDHEGGIYLGGLASNEFGHWPNEFLPKLEFFEQHPDFKKLPIIVDEKMPQSHFEFLQYVTDNRVVCLPANTGWRCKRLLVASTPAFIPTDVVKDHQIPLHELAPLPLARLQFLHDRVAPKVQGESLYGRNLYLSRRNIRTRPLLNEAEIEAYMSDLGFDIVHVEKLSFSDQVRMFKHAACIVAPNGSGLLNLIYANKDVKLLVLSQPNLNAWGGYYGLMSQLGYDMVFVVGDDVHDAKHAEYSVPVDRIGEALAFVGGNPG